ncbi:Uncharacterised protein [uncultured archaeon]|nr:Uncharacterised protein [uncultured archaeon]
MLETEFKNAGRVYKVQTFRTLQRSIFSETILLHQASGLARYLLADDLLKS